MTEEQLEAVSSLLGTLLDALPPEELSEMIVANSLRIIEDVKVRRGV